MTVRETSTHPPQFTLRTLLGLVSAFAGGASVVHWFGIRAVFLTSVAAVVLTVLMIAWSCAFLRAPQLTRCVTVFGVMGFFAASLTTLLLLHSRDEARRLQMRATLAESGFLFSRAKDLYPSHPESRIVGDTWPGLTEFEGEGAQ